MTITIVIISIAVVFFAFGWIRQIQKTKAQETKLDLILMMNQNLKYEEIHKTMDKLPLKYLERPFLASEIMSFYRTKTRESLGLSRCLVSIEKDMKKEKNKAFALQQLKNAFSWNTQPEILEIFIEAIWAEVRPKKIHFFKNSRQMQDFVLEGIMYAQNKKEISTHWFREALDKALPELEHEAREEFEKMNIRQIIARAYGRLNI